MPKIDDIKNAEEVVPKAREDSHGVIIDWLSGQKRGKLLDAPAGYGHLAMRLKKIGYDVVCGEIQPEIIKVKGVECVYTDLNREIPASDESFDYTCCVDGLEHMTNPYRAVEEFARVLKPGGIAIFCVPNYSNIEKRLHYLAKGFFVKPKTIEDYRKACSNLFDFHNTALSITLLDFIFSINGLIIQDILRDKIKRKQYFFLPLVLPLKLIAFLSPEKSKNKYRYDLTLDNRVILGGNEMIFITKKENIS
jgi:SAM-dependent methyltransferase